MIKNTFLPVIGIFQKKYVRPGTGRTVFSLAISLFLTAGKKDYALIFFSSSSACFANSLGSLSPNFA